MKKFIVLLSVLYLFNSCEKPSDCIESSGATITKEIPVAAFKKIKVYRGIEVIITQGTEYNVKIVAGENFIDDIEVKQNGDQLIFKDNTSCNWVRDYGQTKILVTTPTLEEVRSKSDRTIRSNGVLSFSNLHFLSLDQDADGEKGAGTGDFILNLNVNTLTISNNNVSRFYLSGHAETANFYFYFGDGRIEAENLIAKYINTYHRGSNDMILYPIETLKGTMNSTGNIILKNNPPIVDVQQLYQGRVIFN